MNPVRSLTAPPYRPFPILVFVLLLFAAGLAACRQDTPGEATNTRPANTRTPSPTETEDESATETGTAGQPTSTRPESIPTATSEDDEDTAGDNTPTTTPRATTTTRTATTATAAATTTAGPTRTPVVINIADLIDIGGAKMVYVPGGTFSMGYEAEPLLNECAQFREGCLEAWFEASAPQHEVTLDPFYIDAFEVTSNAYLEFLNTVGTHEGFCFNQDCLDLDFTRSRLEDGEYTVTESFGLNPVLGVSWFGAAAYCQWRGARLPTEAEWEMAATWDPDTEVKTLYPWGDEFDGQVVSFCDASCQEPQANPDFDDGHVIEAPTGIFPAGRSPVGAYEMGGNVWEWVADWFSPTYYQESESENPRGPSSGEERVVRGGSWFDTGNFTSGVLRFAADPAGFSNTIGFRCALDG